MDYIFELISQITESSSAQRWIFIALVSGAVFALGLSGEYIFTALKSPLQRRLANLEQSVDWSEIKSEHEDNKTKNPSFLSEISSLFLPKHIHKNHDIKAQLIRAGIRTESSLGAFYAIKTLLLIIFAFTSVMFTKWLPHLSSTEIFFYTIAASYIGFIAPNMILDRIESNRIRVLRNSFPDALDLFVVCVESGLGLTATIPRVAKELDISHPELSDELNLVSSEIRLGVDRIDALRGLATRTGLDEIRGLVALIDQSVRFGTGIAETLRVYSEEFRDKRTQKAEEEAAKIGTKLIFPLTFCIWPGFFLVAIGPAIVGIMEAFK